MKKIILISLLSLFNICSTGYAELVDNGDDTVKDTKDYAGDKNNGQGVKAVRVGQ